MRFASGRGLAMHKMQPPPKTMHNITPKILSRSTIERSISARDAAATHFA